MTNNLRVRDLGEQGLLQRLFRFCPSHFVGDDAALLTVAPGQSLVVTTDLLVDGVHFSDRTTSPADVGWRSTAANLSDLAAMGATPLGITVGLSLPGDLPVSWVEQLYQGMADCLQPYQAAIVGGDVCRSNTTTVSITALGQVYTNRAIQRSVAQPGDVILVTGAHGASRAGLELLLHPEQGQMLSAVDRSAFIHAHQRPCPRLDVVTILNSVFPLESQPASPAPLRIAGMDSSDGLADAVLQVCRASGVGAVIDRREIPLPAGLLNWVGEAQAIDWVLYGGEDFELVLCLPEELATILQQQVRSAAVIGTITPGSEVILQDSQSQYADQVLSLSQGFQHF